MENIITSHPFAAGFALGVAFTVALVFGLIAIIGYGSR